MPSLELQAGTFTSKEDADSYNFFKKMGMPQTFLDNFKGVSSRFTNSQVDDKWVTYYTVDGHPEYSSLESFREGGEETEVNSPLFFGKAKVSFKAVADNTCHTIIKTEDFGTLDLEEKYTLEGANFSYKHRESGATLKCFCPRVFDNDGWYRMIKKENCEAYNKAVGMPNFNITDYLFKHKQVGNVIHTVDLVNDNKDVGAFPLDKEITHTFKLEAAGIEMTRNILTIQLAPNKFMYLSTAPNGRKEEWTTTFDNNGGCLMSGFDRQSKETCKIYFEKTAPFRGVYKNVTIVGMEEMGAAMGMPPDMISKMTNDFDARLTVTEKDGYVRSHYESKVFPIDICFKFDEEFTMTYPGIPGTHRCIETRMGNKYMSVAKGPKFTTRTSGYVTDNYLVQEVHILGTNIKTKTIMERVE